PEIIDIRTSTTVIDQLSTILALPMDAISAISKLAANDPCPGQATAPSSRCSLTTEYLVPAWRSSLVAAAITITISPQLIRKQELPVSGESCSGRNAKK